MQTFLKVDNQKFEDKYKHGDEMQVLRNNWALVLNLILPERKC